jgi:N6-L-threonylcarbamoyladenine synthase
VVPEVASRNHLAALPRLVHAALDHAKIRIEDVDAFAATCGPGLPTALLVGMAHAKGLVVGTGKPFLAVNHVDGHLFSPFFGCPEIPPHLGLVVSGGHTLLVDVAGFGNCRLLGSTLDDAAGEAFDKVAKLLGLGYPGGVEIERLARDGDATRYEFPRSMLHSGNFQFSFSGLKTAVRYLAEREEISIPDACASFQEAVVEVLVAKAVTAALTCGRDCIAVSGGVSSNGRLQALAKEKADEHGLEVKFAPRELRTDNAAMIAYVAALQFAAGETSAINADVEPGLPSGHFDRVRPQVISAA